MNKELVDRLDMIMANLKPIEPSLSFDIEFRKRLDKAMAEKSLETVIESLARKTAMCLRYVLLPKTPALATRGVALAFALIVAGIYVYSIQPMSPVLLSQSGAVYVRGAETAASRQAVTKEGLRIGDTITTDSGSQADIALDGKYTLRLKEKTKIKIARFTPRRGRGSVLLELFNGTMLVSIDEGFKGSTFIVNTKTTTAKAVGTKFSISVSEKDKPKTDISVLEGKVEVESRHKPENIVLAKEVVMVEAGQKTEVYIGEVPCAPQGLMEEEWRNLEELYQIGRKPRVILLIKNVPDRVKELLGPCPIFISDARPRVIPELLEETVLKIKKAIETDDKALHLESVKLLERLVEEHPNPKYDIQFLLYIGAYYEYLDYHDEAMLSFDKVVKKYPHSPLASIAQCAIGVIYEEKLGDIANANNAYEAVLKNYPNSLEAIWVKNKKHISRD